MSSSSSAATGASGGKKRKRDTWAPANATIGKLAALDALLQFQEDKQPTTWAAARALIIDAGPGTPCASYGAKASPPPLTTLLLAMRHGERLPYVYALYAAMIGSVEVTVGSADLQQIHEYLLGAALCGTTALMKALWSAFSGLMTRYYLVNNNAYWELACCAALGCEGQDVQPLATVIAWFEAAGVGHGKHWFTPGSNCCTPADASCMLRPFLHRTNWNFNARVEYAVMSFAATPAAVSLLQRMYNEHKLYPAQLAGTDSFATHPVAADPNIGKRHNMVLWYAYLRALLASNVAVMTQLAEHLVIRGVGAIVQMGNWGHWRRWKPNLAGIMRHIDLCRPGGRLAGTRFCGMGLFQAWDTASQFADQPGVADGEEDAGRTRALEAILRAVGDAEYVASTLTELHTWRRCIRTTIRMLHITMDLDQASVLREARLQNCITHILDTHQDHFRELYDAFPRDTAAAIGNLIRSPAPFPSRIMLSKWSALGTDARVLAGILKEQPDIARSTPILCIMRELCTNQTDQTHVHLIGSMVQPVLDGTARSCHVANLGHMYKHMLARLGFPGTQAK